MKKLLHLDIRKNKITSLSYFCFNQVYKLKSLKVYGEIEMEESEVAKLFKSDFTQNVDHLNLGFVNPLPLSISSMDYTISTFALRYLYIQNIEFKDNTLDIYF
jgi:hypothetical protein